MKSKIIHSENPLEHWSDIEDLQGKIVLDLGCGWLWQPFDSTTEYFLKRGAVSIIGVDITCEEIHTLQQKYPHHNFLCRGIDTAEDLRNLLITHRPQFIKMDIEGKETVLQDITPQDFSSVEEVAVEYHNPECKRILEQKLQEFSFEITARNQFGYYCTDPEIMGVMHARKIKTI